MNILKVQNELRSVPDNALIGYVQNPTGHVPTYLALSELQRRKDMRAKVLTTEPSQTTVAEDLEQQAQPQGIAAIQQPAQAPVVQPGVAGLPVPDQMFSGQGMAAGGIVAFEDGGDVAASDMAPMSADMTPTSAAPGYADMSYDALIASGVHPMNAAALKGMSPSPESYGRMRLGATAGGSSPAPSPAPSYGTDMLSEMMRVSPEAFRYSYGVGRGTSPYAGSAYSSIRKEMGSPGYADGGEVATSRVGDFFRGLGNANAVNIDKQIGALQAEKNKIKSDIFKAYTPSERAAQQQRLADIDSQISTLTAQRNTSTAPSVTPGVNVPGSQAAADALIRGSLDTQSVNPYTPPQVASMPAADTTKAFPTFEGVGSALPKPMTLDQAIEEQKAAYSKMGVDPNFYTDQSKKLESEREALKGEKSQAGWMALAKAGLGMAAGKSPFALQNIATGAMQGVEQYGLDVKDLRKEQNLLRASDQKLAEAQYLQSRGDAEGALKAMRERDKLVEAARERRDTINATIQAAKIGASARAGIDEDTIARGFKDAVASGEFKNNPEDYLRYKSLFTGAGTLPAGVKVTKNK
jgi:hypothetical protein